MNTDRETPQTNSTEAVCLTLEPETRWLLLRDLAARLERENENLRNALHLAESAYRDAHYALAYVYNDGAGSCAFPFRTDDDLCSENRFHHVKDALDALKPFIND